MKQQILKVTENIRIAENVWKMVLESPELEEQKPGQFVNIRLDGLYLRRPIFFRTRFSLSEPSQIKPRSPQISSVSPFLSDRIRLSEKRLMSPWISPVTKIIAVFPVFFIKKL